MGAFPFLLLSLAMLAVAPGQSGHPAARTRSGELRDLTGTWISVSDKNATDVVTECVSGTDLPASACDAAVRQFEVWGCSRELAELGVAMLAAEFDDIAAQMKS